MVRVDAHHHLWRLRRGDYAWLTRSPTLAPICRDFDLDDLRPRLKHAGIDATVLVQATPTLAETRFLLDAAHASRGLVRAVVGWADFEDVNAIATLAKLAADPLLKSVRPMLQDLDDPRWILKPAVGEVLSALPGLGLRLDALVTPRELPFLAAMMDRHPDVPLVLDHCAKPDIAGSAWQPWADDIAQIARNSQGYCKISGLVTQAGNGWVVEMLRRYVDHVLDCFGASRVMWGSDWPVMTLAASYDEWVAATDQLVDGVSAAERDAIYSGNAIRFYGLV